MSENIRSTNLRFNLDKDVQNRAWQYLQTMDKKKFKSYSQIIAISLVDYFDRYYKKQDEPYLETREREERFVEQIVTAVENAMKPLGKAAVWPGGNGACPLHVRDHHSSFSCDKTDCGAADRRDAAAVRPCGDFCTDAGVWKAAVAVYR